MFNDLLDVYPEYKKCIPAITENAVCKTIEKIGMRVKTKAVVELVMARYNLIG